MKKINLNIVPEDPYLVLIALNPTEESLRNNAVFSRDEGFWNLLRDAGLIDDVSHLPLSDRAIIVKLRLASQICCLLFMKQILRKLNLKLGQLANY